MLFVLRKLYTQSIIALGFIMLNVTTYAEVINATKSENNVTVSKEDEQWIKDHLANSSIKTKTYENEIEKIAEELTQKTLQDLYAQQDLSLGHGVSDDNKNSSFDERSFEKLGKYDKYDKYDKYVFVSASLLKKNLFNLAKEAKKINAILVIRGLIDNSYPKTASYLQDIISKAGVGFLIDPELFQKFQIKNVPSFVLAEKAKSCFVNQDCIAPRYDKLEGNISLNYAFTEIENKGELLNE